MSPLPDCPNPFTQDQQNTAKQKSDDANAKLNQVTSDYTDKLTQYNNGTFTLSAQEQPDVDRIKESYEALIQQQTAANATYEQSLSTASLRFGGSGTVDSSTLQQDQQKITSLQTQRDAQIAITIGSFAKSRTQALKFLYQIDYKQANDNYNRTLKISSCPVTDSKSSNLSPPAVTPASSATSSSCPLNSSVNASGSCTCNAGLYTGLGDDANKCIPRDQVMQEMGVSLYGPQTHYNTTTTNYECNAGYIFENGSDSKNNKCILLSDWNAKNKTADNTTTSSTTPVAPKKQIQISNTKILGLIKNSSALPAAITTQSIASSTSTTTSAGVETRKTTNQKHWYEWLNPINWFSWLH